MTDDSERESPFTSGRTFGSSSNRPRATEATESKNPDGRGPRKVWLITAGALALVGVVSAVMSFGFGTPPPTVSKADERALFEIRQEIQTAETALDNMPSAATAERALVRAETAALEVAALQNDSRFLAASAAAGTLKATQTADLERSLTPYFVEQISPAVLDPWYLLRMDADVTAGSGMPTLFDSGFQWFAQPPSLINVDGTITVTWLALETRVVEGTPPRLLAWVSADYDTVRQVFVDATVVKTTIGSELGVTP